MSPSTPQRGSASSAFAAVKIPWLVMTGTLDSSPIGNASAASRREVFAALPPPSKDELVLDGAEHSAFTDRALPGDKATRNPNHHRAILALSTAFWDAYCALTAPHECGSMAMVRARCSSRGICGLENSCWQLAVGCCSIYRLAAIQPAAASREPQAANCEPRAPSPEPRARTTELPNYRATELPN